MIDSIYVATSGMLATERALNVISNNVTNMNTPGSAGQVKAIIDSGQLAGAATLVLARPPITYDRGKNKNSFFPRLTKRPSEFHVRIPARLVASGFCLAISMTLPNE